MSRGAVTSVPLHPLLAERWSPRAYDASHTIGDAQLAAVLEAARWAPSARNGQPWRFVVGRRGDATFKKILQALMPGNQTWAGSASALVVAVAAERDESGAPIGTAAYDTGLAVAHLITQAHAEGLHARQMGGFHAEPLSSELGVPEGFRPLAVVAVGRRAAGDAVPAELVERETAPRERRPLAEIAYGDAWGTPLDLA
jgi:nitroreductase